MYHSIVQFKKRAHMYSTPERCTQKCMLKKCINITLPKFQIVAHQARFVCMSLNLRIKVRTYNFPLLAGWILPLVHKYIDSKILFVSRR